MPIKKAQLVIGIYKDYREICEIGFNKNSKDFYFYDKSNPIFHISLHKDNSIRIRSNDKKLKPKKLFAKGYLKNNFSIMPFIYYLSGNTYQYPIAKISKNGYLQIKYDDKNYINNHYLFKLFIKDLNKSINLEDISNCNKNITGIKMEGTKNNGELFNKTFKQIDFQFNHFKPYFDFIPIKREGLEDLRMIRICKPNAKLNLTEYLINNLSFDIDLKKLKPEGLILEKFNINRFKVYQIVY